MHLLITSKCIKYKQIKILNYDLIPCGIILTTFNYLSNYENSKKMREQY